MLWVTDVWVLSATGSRPIPTSVARSFPHLFEILGSEGEETYVADTTFERIDSEYTTFSVIPDDLAILGPYLDQIQATGQGLIKRRK